jgi:hypothetical protein
MSGYDGMDPDQYRADLIEMGATEAEAAEAAAELAGRQ